MAAPTAADFQKHQFFPTCRHIGDYETLNKISEGTYGIVCAPRCTLPHVHATVC
jgi:hypothetical protein